MTNEKLSFKFVTEYHLREEIINLDGSKATPIGDIPVDVLNSTVDTSFFYINNQKFKQSPGKYLIC